MSKCKQLLEDKWKRQAIRHRRLGGEITARVQEGADKIDDGAYFIASYNCILPQPLWEVNSVILTPHLLSPDFRLCLARFSSANSMLISAA